MNASNELTNALFEVGDEVEYIGERKTWDSNMKPLIEKGMRFMIIETVDPYVGRGVVGYDEDGEEITDNSKDGYNIYKRGDGQRTIIWPKNASEWKRIEKEYLTLKWGTFKSCHYFDERANALLEELNEVSGTPITEEERDVVCKLIDLINLSTGYIYNHWDGKRFATKKAAKEYVMNYGKNQKVGV